MSVGICEPLVEGKGVRGDAESEGSPRQAKGVSEFIEKKLKLKVNEEKSAVGKPIARVLLGVSFYERRKREYTCQGKPRKGLKIG